MVIDQTDHLINAQNGRGARQQAGWGNRQVTFGAVFLLAAEDSEPAAVQRHEAVLERDPPHPHAAAHAHRREPAQLQAVQACGAEDLRSTLPFNSHAQKEGFGGS